MQEDEMLLETIKEIGGDLSRVRADNEKTEAMLNRMEKGVGYEAMKAVFENELIRQAKLEQVVNWLVELRKLKKEEKPAEQWQELKETIIELRDNDGVGTQQEVCKFLANLMDVLEKQMEEPYKVSEYDKDHIWYRGKQYISLRRFLEVKSKTCDDAISRQAVLDIINFEDNWLHDTQSHNANTKIAFSGLKSKVKALQPVKPQQKTGKWITLKDEYGDIHEAVCSCCDKNGNHKWAYCPNCGSYNGGEKK